ncbi:hypothetical protein GQ53DRAFT_424602 [Thozetella sp. PMI_491]|nr:hypothetical protein GQ53DRAFT_424602 [Thozetella sp. PMI_491]
MTSSLISLKWEWQKSMRYGQVVGKKGTQYIFSHRDYQQSAIQMPNIWQLILGMCVYEDCPGFVHSFLFLVERHLLVANMKDSGDCALALEKLAQIRDLCEILESYPVARNQKQQMSAFPADHHINATVDV